MSEKDLGEGKRGRTLMGKGARVNISRWAPVYMQCFIVCMPACIIMVCIHICVACACAQVFLSTFAFQSAQTHACCNKVHHMRTRVHVFVLASLFTSSTCALKRIVVTRVCIEIHVAVAGCVCMCAFLHHRHRLFLSFCLF